MSYDLVAAPFVFGLTWYLYGEALLFVKRFGDAGVARFLGATVACVVFFVMAKTGFLP